MEGDPILVPVDRWQGKSVEIEITQTGGPQARIDWRGIGLVPDDPRVRTIFDDERGSGFLTELTAGMGSATLSNDSPFAGRSSLMITEGSKETGELAGGPIPIREFPSLGEFRFIRFAWKSRGRSSIALHFSRDDEWGTAEGTDPRLGFRYRAGRDPQTITGPAYELREEPPQEWESVTRDLYGDFGAFDLTGLRFSAGAEGSAEFDDIRVGRREEDLKR
jgi:hypothetical protein